MVGGGVFLAEAASGFFFFLARVPLFLSGQSRFRAIFKTSDTVVNLLHVFSDRVSRDAKTIKEGGLGKRHASAASKAKQVKQGPVLRGPASLAVFSCGIRLTPLEAVIDGCSLPKTQRNQALVLLVISGPISKGTSFSHMLLLGPFRTTHSYFDNSVSICPTSVSHYKWTLSKHTSVHAKR